MLVYGKYECLVMQMLYACVLCSSCGSSQCCILRPYGRGILQSQSHDRPIGSHECLLLFTPSCFYLSFVVGLCACTEML